MTIYQMIGMLILVLFYGAYILKMMLQRRKGIITDRMAKGDKKKETITFELTLKIITYSVAAAQFVSIYFLNKINPIIPMYSMGVVIATLGIVVFVVALVHMKDSWRAGIDLSQETRIVTTGIYKYSRNPAFLGFDLLYIGLAIAFSNVVLVCLTFLAIVAMHFQILQEESYLPQMFGEPYSTYKKRTPRYLFFK